MIQALLREEKKEAIREPDGNVTYLSPAVLGSFQCSWPVMGCQDALIPLL